MPRSVLATVALVALAAAARPQPDEPPAMSDADVLKAVGLNPADGPGLVGYLKLRTVSDVDRGKLDEIIHRFAADKFEDRLAAAAAAERLGPVAISPLRKAADDKTLDPEIQYRAGAVLKKLQTVDHAKVSAAAVRAVAKLRPPGAAAALLGFLPLADSEGVADDIRTALKELAVQNGKAEPALIAGLADESPVRRVAAYTALIEGGPGGKGVPDALEPVTTAVRRDPDPEAKFRGLWALVHTTRRKEFVPDLIAMIPTLPRGRLWQLEDLLLHLAGTHPPGGRFGKSAESLATARDAWAAWWANANVDLAKADLTPRVKGLTDLVQQDPSFGKWGVVTLGPDLKEVWRLGGNPQLMQPYDARMLSNDRVLVTEHNYGRVTERDRAGEVLHMFSSAPQPLSAEVLPNGHWLIVARSMILETDPKQAPRPGPAAAQAVRSYTRPRMPPQASGFDILAGTRLPNGQVVFVTSAPQGPNFFRLDDQLKEVGAPLTVDRFQNYGPGGIDATPEGRVLVTHQDKVAEYDPKDGKRVWSYDVPFPTSVQRLPNGNTLIAVLNQNRVIEVTPEKEVVWEYRGDGVPVMRAYRR